MIADDGVVFGGDECGHVQPFADGCSAAADHAFAPQRATIAVDGRQAGQSRRFTTIEFAQLSLSNSGKSAVNAAAVVWPKPGTETNNDNCCRN